MKVLVVDDHAVVREGLAAILGDGGRGATIIPASSGGDALTLAARHGDLDLVLIDLQLPDASGMSLLIDFGRRLPGLPVLVFSASESIDDVRRALALGALGYVAKSAGPATLLAAIDLVMAGEIYVPPFVVKQVAPLRTASVAMNAAPLTDRQAEILAMIGADISNKEIARRLDISEKTVKAHLGAIFRAVDVSNRAEAARSSRGRAILRNAANE